MGLGICTGPWRCRCPAGAQGTCCGLWFPARAPESGRAPEQWALLPHRLTDQSPGQKLQPALRRPHGRMQERPHVPELLPVHPPCVWNARLAKALVTGHRALPEGMAAPSPGLASMLGSQNRLPDLTARSAQDSLAPGPELGHWRAELTRPMWAQPHGSAAPMPQFIREEPCPGCGPCLPGHLDAEMQLVGVPHSWPWALQPLRPQLSPARPQEG